MDPLKPRFLGETGVQVTPLGLGAAQLGELYVKVSENQAQQTLGCFIRELLLTFSLSSTTCDSAWVSRGFSVIKHV